jgi:hypothetical protein
MTDDFVASRLDDRASRMTILRHLSLKPRSGEVIRHREA